MKQHWRLDPSLDFLNHGSLGATPTDLLRVQRHLQDSLERNPVRFLAPERDLTAALDAVRNAVATLVGADPGDLAFVRNATDGVNAVLGSLPLAPGDEVLVTNHGYNACNNAAHYHAARRGAAVRVIDLPWPLGGAGEVVAAVTAALSPASRLLLIDHVTSPTGLVLPVADIIAAAHAAGVRVMIDGAHAPGMLPLDLRSLDADYYTANHHKWLCAPKASGFLFVRRRLQHEVRPTAISHGANRLLPGRSRFTTEFDWTGTHDPTPLLTVPAAIDWLGDRFPGGLPELMQRNRALALAARRLLCSELGIAAPAPDEVIASLVALPLPAVDDSGIDCAQLRRRLFTDHRFELPLIPWPAPGHCLLRIALQVYNDIGQVERLASVLRAELAL